MAPNSASSFKKFLQVASFCGIAIVAGGCELQEKLERALHLGSRSKKPAAPSSQASQGSDEYQYSSANAAKTKANAEILQEMFRVVLERDPKDKTGFGNYVDALNQGASIEGVYNGFIHSSYYRSLEETNQGASPRTLVLFASELALLEAELSEPTVFDEKSARPLERPVTPSVQEGVEEIEFGQKASPSPSPSEKPSAERYAKLFVGASVYTLKRVLGDEALKVAASKSEYPEKLALWYSKWAAHMAAYKIDFGLAQRNKMDEQFHFGWAVRMGGDRTRWEILNRLHRLLNEANKARS